MLNSRERALRVFLIILAIAVSSSGSLPLGGQANVGGSVGQISGHYEGSGETKQLGTLALTLELSEQNGEITGSLGSDTPAFAVSASYRDSQLVLTFKFAEQEGRIIAQYKEGVISGRWSLGEDSGTIRLTRTRQSVAVGDKAPQPEMPPRPPNIAFVNVNVVPMDKEMVLKAQTVVVTDGRIVSVGPASAAHIPANALRIDGRGKFLIPGLIDMHVHVFADARLMRLFVANGVTTVRNMAGKPQHLKLREQIAAGQTIGPTLYTCGPLLLGYKDPEAVKREIAKQCNARYDCLKIYNVLDWSREAYDAAIDAAIASNVPAVGHLPRNLSIEDTLRPGRQTVEHVEEFLYPYFFKLPVRLDESKIPYVAKLMKDADIAVDPTLIVYRYIARIVDDASFKQLCSRPELRYIPAALREQWTTNNSYRKRFTAQALPSLDRNMAFLRKLTKGLHDAGVKTLLGADTSEDQPFVLPGFSIHEELRELVVAGLSPYEALRAGTLNAAEILRASSDIGTIAPRKRADLILLNANPLEDVANTNRRAGVMLRGVWWPEPELKRLMDALIN